MIDVLLFLISTFKYGVSEGLILCFSFFFLCLQNSRLVEARLINLMYFSSGVSINFLIGYHISVCVGVILYHSIRLIVLCCPLEE